MSGELRIPTYEFTWEDGTKETLPFRIPSGKKKRIRQLIAFSAYLKYIDKHTGFKVSSRGWVYQLENLRLINKDQFDSVENIINECREKGTLSIDFVAEEEGRKFSGIEIPEDSTPIEFLKQYLESPLICEKWYTPDWWSGEEYYIQMLVEKIDLKTLFEPVCLDYHIPVATSKGWSSKLQRAEYARRFKQAEGRDLKCVLLYCGDFDPDGGRISDSIRSNLDDLKNVVWSDGARGYNPVNLIIDRFGLNKGFIDENKLTWIDNLITGSGKNLADPKHSNYGMEYVQTWLRDIGEQKCEANALVTRPDQGRTLCRNAIESYIGSEALSRLNEKRQRVTEEMDQVRKKTGLSESIDGALKLIDECKEAPPR